MRSKFGFLPVGRLYEARQLWSWINCHLKILDSQTYLQRKCVTSIVSRVVYNVLFCIAFASHIYSKQTFPSANVSRSLCQRRSRCQMFSPRGSVFAHNARRIVYCIPTARRVGCEISPTPTFAKKLSVDFIKQKHHLKDMDSQDRLKHKCYTIGVGRLFPNLPLESSISHQDNWLRGKWSATPVGQSHGLFNRN